VGAEQDAAQDRVLAARADLEAGLGDLGASARYAVDVPARVRRSPAKAAAVVGGIAFLLLRGPQRLWRAFRRNVLGRNAPLPKRMLPKEIEKAIDKMGDDGDKVRGTLERDFADYVKQRQKERRAIPTVLLLAAARPILGTAARRAAEYLTAPPSEGPQTRIGGFTAQVGARARELRDEAATKADEARSSSERAASAAEEQIDRTADEAKERVDKSRGEGPSAEEPPTGV
jgi:hypothetical protein